MNEKLMADLVNFRVLQWETEEKERKERAASAAPPERRVITISRQYGAGGHSIAELIAKRLGPKWTIWDKEIVDEVSKSANVRAPLVAALDEHSKGRLAEILHQMSQRWELSPEEYYKHLVEVLLALSQQGNKVIIGRGANFVLRKAFRVRLCASERFRAWSIGQREGVTADQARLRIAQVEAERSRFVRSFFHRDVDDPSEYDLILNSVDRIGFEAAATAIAATMEVISATAKH